MAGYSWNHGMSNNAVAAYADGELPASKMAAWLRKEHGITGCTTADVRQVLNPSSWHHTSKKFNETDFFSTDDAAESLEELKAAVAARKQHERIWKKSGLQQLKTTNVCIVDHLDFDGSIWLDASMPCHEPLADQVLSVAHALREMGITVNVWLPQNDGWERV